MEHEKLNRLLPDGVDPSESDALDATWQMLGAIDAPAPDSERMRARLDAVIDAIEQTPTVIRPRIWQRTVPQGLGRRRARRDRDRDWAVCGSSRRVRLRRRYADRLRR